MRRIGSLFVCFSLGCVAISGCAPSIEPPTSQSAIVAQFDPTVTPPVVPLPNDLARNAQTGLLAVPDFPGASPAQIEFNKYLRTLDGFPPATPVTATFSDAIDPTSVTWSSAQHDGAVFVIDYSRMQPLSGEKGAGDYDLKLSDDGKTLTIVPHFALGGAPSNQPWKLGHSYTVIVFGGSDKKGVHGKDGTTPVIASPTTFLVRSRHPLLSPCPPSDRDILAARCLCPMSGAGFDANCLPATGLTLDQAKQLEPGRQALLAQLTTAAGGNLLTQAGVAKQLENVVLVWSFTISHGPFATLDPTLGKVPFPNDILIDQKTGKVNLPAGSAPESIRASLNQLHGFSTTADATVSIEVADDTSNMPPANATAQKSVLLLNTTEQSRQPDFTVAPEMINMGKDYDGLLTIHPSRPLRPDGARYVAVLTSEITDGKMRTLRPSPVMQLVKLESPLIDANKHSTLPGTVSDADAQQLEPLRTAYSSLGLWHTLEMPPFSVPKDKVAMVWTFTTQPMTQDLRDLAAYPTKNTLPTDVTIDDVELTRGALGPDVDRIVWGSLHTHLALGSDGTLDITGGRDVTIPFVMTTPKMAPPGGAPVAMVQHGLGQWRGDVRAIAEAFASQGWAAMAIDINYHGARSACTKDAECAAGGTCNVATGACSTRLAVKCTGDSQCAMGGTCDKTAGTCSTALAPSSGLCMTWLVGGVPHQECNPVASASAFLTFANPFALRDNLRQHVLDLAQLERVVTSDAAMGLSKTLGALMQPILIDTTHTAYIGQSLGGIEGTLFASVAPQPINLVLNVPGGRLVDLFVNSPTFKGLVAPVLAGLMVAPDTAGYYQLLNVFRWILDPGDPINFGRNIVNEPLGMNLPKKVIVQEAGMDLVIPNASTDWLVKEIGLPVDGAGKPMQASAANGGMNVSTFFPSASHGFLFTGEASTMAGQIQAVGWIASDGKLVSPPSK